MALEWQSLARCRGQDIALFFGLDGERGVSATARDEEAAGVCEGCPVLAQCREHALGKPEVYGTWGGMSEAERRLERRRRQRRRPGSGERGAA